MAATTKQHCRLTHTRQFDNCHSLFLATELADLASLMSRILE